MSEVKTETAAKSRQAAKRETVQKKTMVYVGPTIKNVVSTGTIYNNGIPEKLTKEITKQPVVGNLLVPVEELAAAQKELSIAGSALKIIYDKVITK